MSWLKHIFQLARFAGRRPVANILRAELLAESEAMPLPPMPHILADLQDAKEFFNAAKKMSHHANDLLDLEKKLRRIEDSLYSADKIQHFSATSKVARLRRASIDDVAFLTRASSLEFSNDNLTLALSAAFNSLQTWHDEFEKSKSMLENRIRASVAATQAKLLLFG